jgi:ferrous iron transport protein B
MQILIATVFLGAVVPHVWSGLAATAAVLGIALLGVALTFGSSWLLSRTLLKGEASTFHLEIPPLRRPKVLQVLYTSLIDRTLFVLWRAVVFAVPAGAAIWGVANLFVADHSLAWWIVEGLDPIGWWLGLNGVILLAYIIAIPANEIVIPTVLMLTVMMTGYSIAGSAGTGVMFDAQDTSSLRALLDAGGWTTLTAICLMLFSLCHNPCSTTLYTIYKETGSAKWTFWAAALPLALGVVICGGVAGVWRLLA